MVVNQRTRYELSMYFDYQNLYSIFAPYCIEHLYLFSQCHGGVPKILPARFYSVINHVICFYIMSENSRLCYAFLRQMGFLVVLKVDRHSFSVRFDVWKLVFLAINFLARRIKTLVV